MTIKNSQTRGQIIDSLKNRNLKLDRKIADNYLKKVNYFQLINGFERLLLPIPTVKRYDTETFDDFVALYEFDKQFSELTFSKITLFETSLKTSIAYNFVSSHCSTLNDTMQYTNSVHYKDPKDRNPDEKNPYPFAKDQNEKILADFNYFILFRKKFLNNLIKTNDWINKSFYRDDEYNAPQDVVKYIISKDEYDNHVAVPFWVAIQTVDFGTLKRTCHYLKDEDMNNVLDDFGFLPSERNVFLNTLDIINVLRNKCAHLSLINRFKTPKDIKIDKGIIEKMNMEPEETGTNPSIISLYDSLKILGYFEDISALKKPLQEIITRNNNIFDKKSYDLNIRLLKRMGNESYEEWELMLSKNRYNLS